MVKKFLFSTVLTTIVAFSVAAVAEEASQSKPISTEKAVSKKKAKVVHHKKAKDDAYSPKHHKDDKDMVEHHPLVNKQVEEVMVFADVKKQSPISQTQDSLVNSDGLSVKVGGKVDVQYGFIDQKAEFRNPSNNANLPQVEDNKPQNMPKYGSKFTNQNAMVSNGELNFSATKDDFNGNKYGLEITANANTSPSGSGNENFASKVFMFMENNAGRFELGANDGVSEAMAVSGTTIAKATGGIDGDAGSWVPYTVIGSDNSMLQDTFLTSPSLPYASQHAKKANKFTYYTPTFNGFKAGFSYVRDVTVQGTLFEALSFKGSGYKNVWEGGLSYENKFDNVGVNLSATGQLGEARVAYESDNISHELKRLAAWQVGGKVSVDALSAAASYGDWGKSGILQVRPTESSSTKANFWTAGLAYDYQDKGGVSLTYMHSERKGAFSMNALNYISTHPNFYNATNKFESLSLGGEYKVMPGMMPYAEFTTFKYKTDLVDAKANKGAVVLTGVKLNF